MNNITAPTVKEELEAMVLDLKAKISKQRKGRKEASREWEEEKARLEHEKTGLSDMLTASRESHKETRKTLVSLQNTPTQKEIQRLKDCFDSQKAYNREKQLAEREVHRKEIKSLEARYMKEFLQLKRACKESKEEMLLEILRGSIGEWQGDLLNVYLESTKEDPK